MASLAGIASSEDIFSEAGLDINAIHEEHGCPTISEYLLDFLGELPGEIRDKYGIDLN